MASTTTTTTSTVPATEVFPSVTMPITVVLTCVLLLVIVAGFISLLFWKIFLHRLFSPWTHQRTPYGDLIHVTTPPENTGLDPFIIKSFPVFLYSSATMKNQGAECAICLSEFSDEDTVRLITVCRHGFHSSCVDLWFELHKTCPVCRCELDPGLVGSGSHESLHNTVTITIQDLNHDQETPPSASSRKRLARFSRSHSTGHFMVKTTDFYMKIKRKRYQAGNSVMFEENAHTTSPSKRLREASGWRFSRSHSTGHFMGKATYVNELTRYEAADKYGIAW